MFTRCRINLAVLISIIVISGLAGCSDKGKVVEPAPFPNSPVVFIDNFGDGIEPQAFLGSKLDALQVTPLESYKGSQSVVITVPDYGDPSGSYAGGAFVTVAPRNLTEYNALTLWAKADTISTLDVVGIGNNNAGTSKYMAEMYNIPLDTNWRQIIIPIPLSEKLVYEAGLFYYAEGPEDGNGYTLWFDEILFETLGTISNPQPTIPTITIDAEVGDTIIIEGATVTFDVNGTPQSVSAMQGYFTFTPAVPGVVSVASDGTIIAVGTGSTTLSATLGIVHAVGTVTINVSGALPEPTTPAPAPNVPEADVISIYSDVYTDDTVDTWSADWDDAEYADVMIGADNAKKYFELAFAGIEFTSHTLDVTGMTRFHMDIWTPISTASPAKFKVKLVDFGADGISNYPDPGDDVEHELTFDENTAPALATGTWVSIDIPMSAFYNLTTREHLAQIIISGDLSTVYVDNIYFYDDGQQTAPKISAPTPDKDPGMVISLFSDAYTDVPVDTWSAAWDFADLENYMIGSDSTKKYTNFLSAGIEFKNPTVDASATTHFHMNIWTPDPTTISSNFKIKLVDFGPNGIYESGGGDDAEDEIVLDESTIGTGIWVSIDVPLSSFVDLTTRGHLGQLIISGTPNTVFVDNVYFYDSGIPEAPPVAAPTPTVHPDSVISLFSDVYTDHPIDTWSTDWDTADVEDYVIDSDNVKKYTNLLFAGIEFKVTTIDASLMTHFHMDVWTPDATNAPAVFRIKLVDFGADDAHGGGDDVEHEITLDETTMNTGSWVSIEIPLTDFIDLTTRGNLAQLIISGDPNTVFVDNVYFHR